MKRATLSFIFSAKVVAESGFPFFYILQPFLLICTRYYYSVFAIWLISEWERTRRTPSEWSSEPDRVLLRRVDNSVVSELRRETIQRMGGITPAHSVCRLAEPW